MRIITGSARGCRLATLEGESTRPTAERAKEAAFSMIQFDIEGRRVLDLFAGSGQLGLEALSRGAAHATFLDSSREAIEIVKENAKKTKLFDRCSISSGDYISFLRAGKERYDIVFLDPPYGAGFLTVALKKLYTGGFLNAGALLLCESGEADTLDSMPELAEMYETLRHVRHGRAYLTLLTPKPAQGGEADV